MASDSRIHRIKPASYQERILFVGSNGGGKTKLAGEMLGAGYPRTVSIDIKGDFEPQVDYVEINKPNDLRWHYAKHIVYRPSARYDDGHWLDEVLKALFRRAKAKGKKYPFILYIDEGLYVAVSSRTGTMRQLAVTGRSLNLGLWVSSQRPKWIPVEVRSEAWRWYIFGMSYLEDEREILKHSKGKITIESLQEMDDFSFWELKRSANTAGKMIAKHYPRVALTA